MSSPARRAIARPTPGVPPRPRPPRPERWTLANGIRILAVHRPTLPQVAIRVLLPAGAAADPDGSEGLASLVGSMLTEGTESLSGDELNRRLDRIGASVSVQVGHDFAELDLLLLSETLGEGIDLLGDMLNRPAFPDAELDRVRAETAEALEARLDEPANVADDALGETLFGPDHPYGRLPLGSVESVRRIARPALVDFHRRHYRPEGAVLVVAGDVDLAGLRGMLDSGLRAWSGEATRPSYPPSHPGAPTAAGKRRGIAWPDAGQSEIRVGGPGMQRDSADWIAGAVANYLLGGSTITGRLGANLREDKGWTYGVRSGFSAAVRPGAWVIETAVDAEVTAAAIDEIMTELTRFLAEPVPEDELRRGKDALILSLPRAFETPGRIVSRLAAVEAFGLPEDYWQSFPDRVEAIDRDDLLRVAHTYFDPARLAALAVGSEHVGG